MNFAKRRELASRLLDGYVHGPAAATVATTRALAKVATARTVVLVEGISDQIAVETLAGRRGRDLDVEGVVVLPIGGAHAIGRYLTLLGPGGPGGAGGAGGPGDPGGAGGAGLRLTGLCDLAEEDVFRRGLVASGLAASGLGSSGLDSSAVGSLRAREDLERLGFYVCVEDLEDELIRAIGVSEVEALIDSQGDLGSFRSLQRQPQWRGRPARAQLRRFLAAGSRRKLRYARLLVGAVALDRLPRPLDAVVTVALGDGQPC
jgi:hypothetical protein